MADPEDTMRPLFDIDIFSSLSVLPSRDLSIGFFLEAAPSSDEESEEEEE